MTESLTVKWKELLAFSPKTLHELIVIADELGGDVDTFEFDPVNIKRTGVQPADITHAQLLEHERQKQASPTDMHNEEVFRGLSLEEFKKDAYPKEELIMQLKDTYEMLAPAAQEVLGGIMLLVRNEEQRLRGIQTDAKKKTEYLRKPQAAQHLMSGSQLLQRRTTERSKDPSLFPFDTVDEAQRETLRVREGVLAVYNYELETSVSETATALYARKLAERRLAGAYEDAGCDTAKAKAYAAGYNNFIQRMITGHDPRGGGLVM